MKITTCLIAVTIIGCTSGASESADAPFTAADSAAVRAGADKWVSTTLARDFDAFGANLSSDVVLYPPNAKPIVGRDAAVAYVKAYPTITKFNINVDEVSGRGDVAYDRGTFTLEAKLPNGMVVNDTGSFFTVFRRQSDGSWPHSRVMWNTHIPAPTAPAPPAPKGK